jgi:hypothetical protein
MLGYRLWRLNRPKSGGFPSGDGTKQATMRDFDKFERRAVRRICLPVSDRWPARSEAEGGGAHDVQLHLAGPVLGLPLDVVHRDGTTTAAKKGDDNPGFSGHKHLKGDKVVALYDRRCNVLAPFIAAPGNQNESPMLVSALNALTAIAKAVGLSLRGTIDLAVAVRPASTLKLAISRLAVRRSRRS